MSTHQTVRRIVAEGNQARQWQKKDCVFPLGKDKPKPTHAIDAKGIRLSSEKYTNRKIDHAHSSNQKFIMDI